MSPGAVAIRGYNVLSESRRSGGFKSYRVRDEDSGELLTLHVFNRKKRPSPDVRALLAALPRYSELTLRQLARPRRIRADENFVIVEVEGADGESVETLLARDRPPDSASALRLLEDLLVGLVAGEMRGLHHGAIRPSCVVVDGEGRAVLDGFGFGALYPDAGDFYSRLTADVPVSMNRRHAKDVYAAVALFHHLVEGRPPFDPSGPRDFLAKVRGERWQGTKFREIYDAVTPLDGADAAGALRRIREAGRAASSSRPAEEAGGPSLLDTPDDPSPESVEAGPAPATQRWRRLAAEPALPVLAAGIAGALIALTFGAPFLGTDAGRRPSVTTAIPLPSAVPLAPSPETRTETGTESKPAEKTAPRRRSGEDAWRQMIVALAEIGDYPAALALLDATKDMPPYKVAEERDAVIAGARRRFDQLHEIGRALTGESRLEEALKEWDAMKGWWPEDELALRAAREREVLVKEAGSLRAARDTRDRLQTAQRQAARYRGLCRKILFEERYDFTGQLLAIDAFLAENPGDGVALAESYAALRECVLRKSAFFKRARESLVNRRQPLPVGKVSARFGGGEIVGLGDDTFLLKRPDATLVRIPLTRLDGGEKLALFREVRQVRVGGDSLAIALYGLGWGLAERAGEDLRLAEVSGDVPAKLMEQVRRLMQEE